MEIGLNTKIDKKIQELAYLTGVITVNVQNGTIPANNSIYAQALMDYKRVSDEFLYLASLERLNEVLNNKPINIRYRRIEKQLLSKI